jgi:hypothetical protein
MLKESVVLLEAMRHIAPPRLALVRDGIVVDSLKRISTSIFCIATS